MALTPDEEQELAGLQAYVASLAPSAPQAPQQSLMGRLGQGLANQPFDVPQNIGRGIQGVVSFLTGVENPNAGEQPLHPYDIPQAKTFGQMATDLVPSLLGTVASAAIPGGIASDVSSALGLTKAAPIIGDVVGGGLLGFGQSPREGAQTGAEFGALGLLNKAPIPGYLKALGNMAIPVGGQLLRGQNPLSAQSLLGTAVNMAVPAVLGNYADSQQPRSLLPTSAEATPAATTAPAPEAQEAASSQIDPSLSPSTPDDRAHLDTMADAIDGHAYGLSLAVANRPEIIQQDPIFQTNPELKQTAQQYADAIASHKASIGDIPTDEDMLDRHGLPLPQSQEDVPFQDRINNFANEAPDSQKSGGNALISHIFDRAMEEGVVSDREDFDNQMIDAHNDGLISMQTAHGEVPAESEIEDDEGNAYHTVEPTRVDPSMTEEAPARTAIGQPDIAKAMQDVAAQYPGVDFRVHNDPSDAPELKGKIKPGMDYEGLSDPSGVNRFGGYGAQYGFTNNIRSATRGEKVAIHEILGHYGFDKVVNPKDWADIERHVMERGGDLRDSIASDYRDRVTGQAASARRVAREYVGRLSENTNLDPTLWQKVTAAVRAGLRAIGIRREWSDNEIRDLIRAAHKNLKEGATPNDLIGTAVDAARSKTPATPNYEPAVQDAYQRLSKRSGFPSVAISDLARESGAPLPEVKSLLTRAHNQGKAVLSLGDWSLSSEEKRAGAIDTAAQKGNLLVRLNGEQIDPSTAREERKYTPALQTPDGTIYTGETHPEAYIKALTEKGSTSGKRGYVTPDGRFIHGLLDVARNEDGGAVDPSLPPRMDDAAREQEKGRKSVLGYAGRFLETNLGLSATESTKVAREKAEGIHQLLVERANNDTKGLNSYRDSLPKGTPLFTPAQKPSIDAFVDSKGSASDLSSLKAAGLAKPVEDYLATHKEVEKAGQTITASAETKEHAAVIRKSLGDYMRQTYEIWANPKQYLKRLSRGNYDKEITAVVNEWKQKPEFSNLSRESIRIGWEQVLNNYAEGKEPSEGSTSGKISQSLYTARKDLSRDQWSTMKGLETDSRLTGAQQGLVQDAIRDQHLSKTTRGQISALSEDTRFSKDERAALGKIAAQETVSPAVRAVLGEYTDPIERVAFTTAKVMRSVMQAQNLFEISNSKSDNGNPLTFETAKDWQVARNNASGDAKRELLRYQELPNVDGFGILAGRWAHIGVHDALNSFNQGMEAGADGFWGKLQKVLKLNATVRNPATHAHWWMQMPLMFAMARVYNPADWLSAAKVVFNENHPMHDEVVRNNIIGAGGGREFNDNTLKLAGSDPMSQFSKIITGNDKATKFLSKLYGRPDDIIRTAAYLKAKGDALKAGMPEQDAQRAAITYTNRYTFNYGTTPRLVNRASNIAGLNPFLRYSSELTRITKNLAEDVVRGTPADRVHGALNLGLMAAVPLAASLGSSSTNLSAKDQQDWDRLRKLEDVDRRGQIKFVLGRDQKTGAFQYVDISPMIPAGDTFNIAKDILKGDWKAGIADQPIFGLSHSPIASLGIDLATGQNQGTGQKLFTAADYAQRIGQSITPPLTPFVGSQANRISRALTPNSEGGLGLTNPRTGRVDTPVTALLGTAGVRLQSEQPGNLLQAAQSDAQEKRDAARQQAMQLLRTNADQGTRDAVAKRYGARLLEINQELQQKTKP